MFGRMLRVRIGKHRHLNSNVVLRQNQEVLVHRVALPVVGLQAHETAEEPSAVRVYDQQLG